MTLKLSNSKIKRFSFFLLFFPFVLFLILFFPSPALAFWAILRDALLFLPLLLIAAVLAFAVLVTSLFPLLMGAILKWVTSPGFVSLSYTRADGANANPIIKMGLDITMPFVNLLLVVFLVFIGLSIALRLEGYGGKKLFVRLIIIALLVNFAPVLCGLIVDASNIVMNYFLNGIREDVTGPASQIVDYAKGIVKSFFSLAGDLSNRLGLIMQGIALIGLNIFLGIAFSLFAVLFIVRYVMIWVLVILSPLAFVFWIMPATKKFWDMWWNNLIQWSIVGIPIAFFLYLAINSFSYLQSEFAAGMTVPGVEPQAVGFLNETFPFFVVCIFLALGFLVGLQSSAMGASAIISATQKGVKSAGKWAGKTGASAARGIPAVSRAEERIRKRLETTPGLNRLVGGPGAYEKEKKAAIGAATKRMDLIPDTPDGNKALMQRIKRTPVTQQERHDRAAAIETLAKRKALKFDDDPAKDAAMAKRFLPEAQRYGADISAIYKARPDYARHFTKIDPVTKKPVQMTVEDAMEKISASDFHKNVQSEALDNHEVIAQALMDPGKIKQMGLHGTKHQKKRFRQSRGKNRVQIRNIISAATRSQQSAVAASVNNISTEPRWKV